MKRFLILGLVLGACTPVYETMTHTEAVAMCQEQANEGSRTTTGNMTFGLNSRTGPSFGAGIGINLTPIPVDQGYESCMTKLAENGQIVGG